MSKLNGGDARLLFQWLACPGRSDVAVSGNALLQSGAGLVPGPHALSRAPFEYAITQMDQQAIVRGDCRC